MTQIELNVLDRVTLSTILAEKESGSRIDMSLVHQLLKEVDFTAKEIEDCGISDLGDVLKYKKDCLIVVNLSDRQCDIIKECLDRADKENRVHLQMIPFWDKFDKTFK